MSNKFPLKLMTILDSHEHQDIISWLPHGRGFIIRDKKQFSDLVLPKYFKESKYTSFTRRLNRWNFTIQTHGHKEASYFHPMFIRGDPQRALEMHPAPQSSKARREARYIDERRRMELGLNFPPVGVVPGDGGGGGAVGGETAADPSLSSSSLSRGLGMKHNHLQQPQTTTASAPGKMDHGSSSAGGFSLYSQQQQQQQQHLSLGTATNASTPITYPSTNYSAGPGASSSMMASGSSSMHLPPSNSSSNAFPMGHHNMQNAAMQPYPNMMMSNHYPHPSLQNSFYPNPPPTAAAAAMYNGTHSSTTSSNAYHGGSMNFTTNHMSAAAGAGRYPAHFPHSAAATHMNGPASMVPNTSSSGPMASHAGSSMQHHVPNATGGPLRHPAIGAAAAATSHFQHHLGASATATGGMMHPSPSQPASSHMGGMMHSQPATTSAFGDFPSHQSQYLSQSSSYHPFSAHYGNQMGYPNHHPDMMTNHAHIAGGNFPPYGQNNHATRMTMPYDSNQNVDIYNDVTRQQASHMHPTSEMFSRVETTIGNQHEFKNKGNGRVAKIKSIRKQQEMSKEVSCATQMASEGLYSQKKQSFSIHDGEEDEESRPSNGTMTKETSLINRDLRSKESHDKTDRDAGDRVNRQVSNSNVDDDSDLEKYGDSSNSEPPTKKSKATS